MQGTLFERVDSPEGLLYRDGFLSTDEERSLLEHIRALEFHEVRMRGVAARRRVVQYGWKYSFESFRMKEGPELPYFLHFVRDRAAAVARVEPAGLAEALVTEYSPGAAIGWHRDAPGFGIVVGISLLSECRFRFRRDRGGSWETTELALRPRSVYVLRGPARSEWQHGIPAVRELRYSITFRTMTRRT